jgi:hypothetical protein
MIPTVFAPKSKIGHKTCFPLADWDSTLKKMAKDFKCLVQLPHLQTYPVRDTRPRSHKTKPERDPMSPGMQVSSETPMEESACSKGECTRHNPSTSEVKEEDC